ncbi:MAG: Lrp/AsnC family transcriptional regulator [Methanobacteriota archaeon]
MTSGLDGIDRRILAILANEGRATLQAISEKVGLRRPSVHERVRKLEAAGVIRGYRAELSPDAVGAGLLAFVLLSAERRGGEDCMSCCERVSDALRKVPEVLEVHTVAGANDLLVKLRARDIRALEEVVLRKVSGAPGVGRVETLIVMSTQIERPLVPPPEPAKKDRR